MNMQRPSPSYKRKAMAKGDYHRLWRVVEGAVIDAIKAHPDYFTEIGARQCVGSVTKRVVGQLAGAANEARKRGGHARPCQAEPALRASQTSTAEHPAVEDRTRTRLPTIRLPYAKTTDLSRNSRKHWSAQRKLDKQQKKDAFGACLEAGIHKHRPKKGDELVVTVTICPPSGVTYPDDDNALSANKAALDQIAAVLRVDDSTFRPKVERGDRCKHGAVLVNVEVIE